MEYHIHYLDGGERYYPWYQPKPKEETNMAWLEWDGTNQSCRGWKWQRRRRHRPGPRYRSRPARKPPWRANAGELAALLRGSLGTGTKIALACAATSKFQVTAVGLVRKLARRAAEGKVGPSSESGLLDWPILDDGLF